MLKAVWNFVSSRKVVVTLVVVALLALVWFAGPLVSVAGTAFLAGESPRLWTMLVIVALWGAWNLIGLRGRSIDAPAPKIVPVARDGSPPSTAGRHPAQAIVGALARLRRLRGRWQAPYCLPWYLVLGPQGAGKTRALASSGLDFLPSRGSDAHWGDTDECACHIAGEAVLIDLKGTTIAGSGERKLTSPTWKAVVETLRRRRRLQPVDGVIVAVDVVALATSPTDHQERTAREIRSALLALSRQMGVRVPVYVLFTQLDRLHGFSEFFASLRREEREQVLGATFSPAAADPAAEFAAIMDGIGTRLAARMQKAVLRVSSLPRRTTLFQFPAQFALLQGPTRAFLSTVFARTALNSDLMPRGAFFAAAGGNGRGEDLLRPLLAHSVNQPADALVAEPPTDGGSFLLQRPLRDFILPEAYLAGRSPPVRRRWAAALALAATVLGVAAWAAGSAIHSTWTEQRAAVRSLAESVGTLDHGFSVAEPPRRLKDVAPILDGLAALRDAAVPADRDTWHLMVPSAIGDVATAAYDDALETVLAPLVAARLEAGLMDVHASPNDTFDTLKVALMFDGEGPLDPAPMAIWFAHILSEAGIDGDTRDRLLAHFRALVKMPRKRPLDAGVLAQARARASQAPLGERAYWQFLNSPDADAAPGWIPGDAAGAAAARALMRISGTSLWQPMPGIFTRSGFLNVFLPQSRHYADVVSAEGWVLGLTQDANARRKRADAIRRDMLTLYLDDFILTWDGLLADIEIIPFSTIGQGAEELNVLTGADSPLRRLFEAVSAETDLSPPPLPKPGAVADPAAALEAAKIQAELAADKAAGFPTPPGKAAMDHFAALHLFVEHKAGAPSQLDNVVAQMRPLYTYLNRLAVAGQPGDTMASLATQFAAGGDTSPLLQVQALATNLPAPAARLVTGVALYGAAATTDDARGFLSAAWRQTVGALCHATLDGRYPHVPTATTDIPAADFAALLGPGGAVDKFFNEHLKSFVDQSRHPWTTKKLGATGLELSPASLAFFEQAASIRDNWFMPGQPTPRLSFWLEPDLVDARVQELTFRLDDQTMIYRHGPILETGFNLAGNKETHVAALTMDPVLPNAPPTLVEKGPWAALRLLGHAKMERTGGNIFHLAYKLGDVAMSFWLRTPSENTPVEATAIQALTCPSDL